jgi:hypothetical protein
MDRMLSYSKTAMERAMKVQGVISRAEAKKITRWQAAEKMAGATGLWKRRGVEKSKNRLSHPAWKSRKPRGIPTFPQPRRLREIN